MKKLFRHGDLLLVEVHSIPSGLTLQGDNVLALGEVTGHKHQFKGIGVKVLVGVKEEKYIEVSKSSPLSHEEHKTIEIPVGKYKLLHEREYDYFSEELKQVQD